MPNFLESLFDPSTLYNALKDQSLLPQWAQTRPVTAASGSYYPDTNQLVAPYPGNPRSRNTTAHEMTHAVQDNLLKAMASHISEKKWNNQPTTDEEERYLREASKLTNTQYGRIGQYDRRAAEANLNSITGMMDKLYKNPDPDPRFDAYRRSTTESQAFGTGGMSQGAMPNEENYGQHLDPTMATEFSILMDLYNRLPKPLRDEAANSRRQQVDTARSKPPQAESVRNYYRFDATDYPNPFTLSDAMLSPLVRTKK